MYCDSIMQTEPTHIHRDAPLHEAVAMMAAKHMQVLMVVKDDHEFVGELTIGQFAKALVPRSMGLDPEQDHAAEAQSETLADVAGRLKPYLNRQVLDFVDHDVPVVRPTTPLIDAVMLLRGGVLRIPVVDGPRNTLVGAVSMLTVMRAVQEAGL